MARNWVIPFFVVALVTALVLYFTRDRGSDQPANGPRPDPGAGNGERPAPVLLSDAEVRAYLRIWPELDRVMRAAVQQVVPPEAGGTGADPKAVQAHITAKLQSLLKRENLSQEDWNGLRQRLKFVVDAVRWERNRPERERELKATIEQKERALEAASGEQRKQLEADLERFRAQIGKAGPKVAEEDLALVNSYWSQLDPLVPGSRPDRPNRAG